MPFTLLYTIKIKIYKFIKRHQIKKKIKKKKNVYAFLIKNTVIYWIQNSNTCSNCQATYQKELLFAVWKIREFFFHRANVEIGLTTLSSCSFSFALYGPPPSATNVLFECPLLMQKVTAGKLNCQRKMQPENIWDFFACDIFASCGIFLLF